MKKIKKILILCTLTYIFFKLFKIIINKVCLCTIGKLENLYINEFINHYKNYGIDKIFIYDNNDLNGERFEDAIYYEYIKNGFVEIINARGKKKYQKIALQECLTNNYKKYKWLIFYDIDEFIYLRDFKNIKNYLDQPKFSKCQTIELNMYYHNDNNLLYYDNRSLSERFYVKVKNKREPVKSILKGNNYIKINSVHYLNDTLKSCNGYGKYIKNVKKRLCTKSPDFKNYYIDHYCFKSTEEFINKINRGSAIFGQEKKTKLRKIGWYFHRNEITTKKIDYIEKYTNLNLSVFRSKINKKLTT